MPTYSACGVTARLTTCDLKDVISSFTDLRMGGEQRKDATRIQKNLSKGEKLGERPIGSEGTDKGVVQFVGVREDLPLLIVEASEKLKRSHFSAAEATETEPSDWDGAECSSESQLTSLGATPTPTQDAFPLDPVLRSEAASTTTEPTSDVKAQATAQKKSKPASSLERYTLEQTLQRADVLYISDEQALALDIQVDHKAFLPARGGSASLGKDLKIEIFFNGELADVSFINARRSAVQIIGDKIRFAGTRLHRQTEKPWVYSPEGIPARVVDAEKQWFAVSKVLEDQARRRGADRYGGLPPSAELLAALAALRFPERLARVASIGIIDLVVTAGKGQKYAADTGYLTRPTPMDDSDFNTTALAVDPVLLPPQDSSLVLDGGAVLNPLQTMNIPPMRPDDSSPDVPLRSKTRTQAPPASPSPTKKAMDLAGEFGFAITRQQGKALTVGAYETAQGKARAEKRSLLQRLADVKKMNERNKARELEKLKGELGDFLRVDAGDPEQDGLEPDDMGRSPKRVRTNSDANYIDPIAITNSSADYIDLTAATNNDAGYIGPSVTTYNGATCIDEAAITNSDADFIDFTASASGDTDYTVTANSDTGKIGFIATATSANSNPGYTGFTASTSNGANYPDPTAPTMSPFAMHLSEPMCDDDVFSGVVNPQAVLSQHRIDMALESGVASNGPLLRTIGSTSPVTTPRKTTASTLAYSPTRTPVKEQKRSGRSKPQTTPQKRGTLAPTTPLFPLDPVPNTSAQLRDDNTAVSPTKSSGGISRSAKKLQREKSYADALKDFEVPELCKGSCVTYARDRQASRQIGKARGGVFKEEGLVVGMRFCVW